MKRPPSLALLSPFLLGVALIIALNSQKEAPSSQPSSAQNSNHQDLSTHFSNKTGSEPRRRKNTSSSGPRQFSLSTKNQHLDLSIQDRARVAALQNLSLAELTQKFEEAIGPTHSRSLPKKRRAQIFEKFRERLSAPLEPTSYLCWSQHTPANIVEASHRAELFAQRLIESEVSAQAFQSIGTGRWTSTASGNNGSAYGTPITLTWSIAPDGALDDNSNPSNLIARLATIYASQGANTSNPPASQPWFQYFVTAIDNLSEETGIIFIYEPNDNGVPMSSGNDGILGIRGDIRIFGADIDGNSGTLAYNYSPGYGDMVIDTNDSFFNNTSNNSIRLRNTLGHEVGHGLGLGHVCPRDFTKLMEPFINTNFDGAQFDEIYSLQRRYGDHLERSGGTLNNDNTTNAGPLNLTPGATLNIPERLSIDDNSDGDYYEISASANQSLTVTVTPTNESYLEGGQIGGECSGGWSNVDFSSYHNLSLQIRNSSGTLLSSSNTQGDGLAESISYTFPSTGNYYLRVLGDSTDRAQIYTLSATLQNPSTILSLTSTDTIAEEGSNTNTASLVVNATTPVATPLTVTLVTSGTASPADYQSDLTATIPAGQLTSNTVLIHAEADILNEGDETLTLTLPVFSSGPTSYGLGTPSSQNITLVNKATPVFNLTSSVISAESFSGQNGVPDPNETIEVTFNLENIGPISGTNVMGTITGPSGFIPFDVTQNFGDLAPSGTGSAPFQFGLTGSCGDLLDLSLLISSDEGASLTVPLQYSLGIPGVPTTEDMEHGGELPPDWTSTTTGAGLEWTANSSQSTSGTYSVFASSTSTTGSSAFTSQVFTLPSPPGTISFSHIYGFQLNKDGAVMEISINGGSWQDIVSAGATFTANGYDAILATSTNPLSGRNAWTGSSGGFKTTSLDLPASIGSQSVQLRWVTGSDESGKFLGWYLDDIFTPKGDSCDTSGPDLVLSQTGNEVAEGDPNQIVTLTVATTPLLPTVLPIPLDSNSSGSTALPASDLAGFAFNPVIQPGESSYTADISAVYDTLLEGNESISLSYFPAQGSVSFSVLDSPFANWTLAGIGSVGAVGPTQDFDLDGSSNLEEYAFQTLAGDANDYPAHTTSKSPTAFKLLAPPKPWPTDLDIVGKSSTDLLLWTETGVTETPDGFEIPLGEEQRFLRMFYSLTPISE